MSPPKVLPRRMVHDPTLHVLQRVQRHATLCEKSKWWENRPKTNFSWSMFLEISGKSLLRADHTFRLSGALK